MCWNAMLSRQATSAVVTDGALTPPSWRTLMTTVFIGWDKYRETGLHAGHFKK
jgi:hypothetical protein